MAAELISPSLPIGHPTAREPNAAQMTSAAPMEMPSAARAIFGRSSGLPRNLIKSVPRRRDALLPRQLNSPALEKVG